jgi:hypothetical protein
MFIQPPGKPHDQREGKPIDHDSRTQPELKGQFGEGLEVILGR